MEIVKFMNSKKYICWYFCPAKTRYWHNFLCCWIFCPWPPDSNITEASFWAKLQCYFSSRKVGNIFLLKPKLFCLPSSVRARGHRYCNFLSTFAENPRIGTDGFLNLFSATYFYNLYICSINISNILPTSIPLVYFRNL